MFSLSSQLKTSPRPDLLCVCSSLAFILLLLGGGNSAGGAAAHVREARPPEQGGWLGNNEQALQDRGVVGPRATARASSGQVVEDGDAGV